MDETTRRLSFVYEGWEGYNRSLMHAVEGLTVDQLRYRLTEGLRSVGEIASHIAFGRIDWFVRMDAPGSAELSARAALLTSRKELADDALAIVDWLASTWSMIGSTLSAWTVDDLVRTYEHEYWGNVYAVSYQWTIWRIMAHDIHHGGQLSELLIAQGIPATELVDLGGHLTEPPIVRQTPPKD